MKKTPLTETVKRLRKQYGLTQEQLAFKSGVGLNFVRDLTSTAKISYFSY